MIFFLNGQRVNTPDKMLFKLEYKQTQGLQGITQGSKNLAQDLEGNSKTWSSPPSSSSRSRHSGNGCDGAYGEQATWRRSTRENRRPEQSRSRVAALLPLGPVPWWATTAINRRRGAPRTRPPLAPEDSVKLHALANATKSPNWWKRLVQSTYILQHPHSRVTGERESQHVDIKGGDSNFTINYKNQDLNLRPWALIPC
jgi:hypothetical protein